MYHKFAAVEQRHWWFQGRRRIVSALLRDYLADPERAQTPGRLSTRILDLGSGTGEMVDMLKRLGTVTAFDNSAEAVDYCRQRHPIGVTVRHGTVPDDLVDGEQFDLVTAFDVLEHIEDDVGALRALRNVLTPGGRLVLTVPAFPALWSQHDVYAGHVRRYRRKHLLAVIAQAGGLRVDRISYFNSLLFLPALAVRAVDRWRRRLVPRHEEHTDPHLEVPPAPVNRALLEIFAAEARLLRHPALSARGLPFGVSLIALCHAPTD